MSEHTCCKRMFRGFLHEHVCGKKAAYEHEGKWYCKTHHPPTVKAKHAARSEKFEAEYQARLAQQRAAAAGAAEQKRRADCYDQLVERVKKLEVACRHCEDLLMRYEINHSQGDEIADAALDQLRAALAKSTSIGDTQCKTTN